MSQCNRRLVNSLCLQSRILGKFRPAGGSQAGSYLKPFPGNIVTPRKNVPGRGDRARSRFGDPGRSNPAHYVREQPEGLRLSRILWDPRYFGGDICQTDPPRVKVTAPL
jgi:hypothetical protein